MRACVRACVRVRAYVRTCVCRDGEPRTTTSTSTQLLSSDPSFVSVLPCITTREEGRPAEYAIFGVCGPVSHGLLAAYDRPRR